MPASTARPATTATGVVSGTSAIAPSGTAQANAVGTSTTPWPCTSTRRPMNGAMHASPSAKAPAATPPSA